MRICLLAVLFLTATSALSAQDADPSAQDTSSAEESATDERPETTAAPDFSSEALSLIFLDREENEEEPAEELLTLRWQDWVIRWLPLIAPLRINQGEGGPTLGEGFPNAMTLLGMDYPGAGAAGDEWSPMVLTWRERHWRWRMINKANAANAADNRGN